MDNTLVATINPPMLAVSESLPPMEIIYLLTSEIQGDKNQPRKTLNKQRIEEMADSIKAMRGLINPIEIDKDRIIVTGQLRWEAAKLAGLERVPCKIIEINDTERFHRQVVENVHHNLMDEMDTAKAFAKMLNILPGSRLQGKDAGLSRLAKEIGKSVDYISQHLDRLEDPEPVQGAIKAGKISYTHARELKKVPAQFKDAVMEKLLSGEFPNSGSVAEVAIALKKNPEKAEEILEEDFSPFKSPAEVRGAVSKFASPAADGAGAVEELTKTTDILIQWLENNSPAYAMEHPELKIAKVLATLGKEIKRWLKSLKEFESRVEAQGQKKLEM